MTETPPLPTGSETGVVLVRYWASARAAAGTDADRVPATASTTLAAVVDAVLAQHAGTPREDRLRRVLASCSVLVGDEPVGTRDHASVSVEPGASVEFLPPFAGG